MHLAIFFIVPGKTHTFTAVNLRLSYSHPEKGRKVLSPTVQKREEKLYMKRKSVIDSVLLRLIQQFLSLRTARHFPLSLPTE
jgi:hypothetical protein